MIDKGMKLWTCAGYLYDFVLFNAFLPMALIGKNEELVLWMYELIKSILFKSLYYKIVLYDLFSIYFVYLAPYSDPRFGFLLTIVRLSDWNPEE